MKKLLLTTGFIAATLAAAPVFAGPTENITGCATEAVEGANYTVRVDPTCALFVEPSGKALVTVAFLESLFDDDEEEEEAAE